MPMHQAPSITDEEVDERLGLAGEHGRLWRAGTAKFFLDGVLESGTAWLVDPGPGGVNATPFWPDVGRYAELVRRFTAAGFSAITHAVGDGAVRGALDAYEAAGPPRRGKHRVEHIETLTDEDLPRFAALDVAASMQPLHMEGMDDPHTPSPWAEGLSAGRLERGFRTRDLVESGARCCRSARTGWSPTTTRASGWRGRGCGARRAGRDHVPFLPEQALDGEQTLRGYTTAPAAVAGDEAVYGRLRVGLRADITALAADPCEVDPDELPQLPVELTVVDGEIV